MARKYAIVDQQAIYFVTFSVIENPVKSGFDLEAKNWL
mgnify:CR=1 FL=1